MALGHALSFSNEGGRVILCPFLMNTIDMSSRPLSEDCRPANSDRRFEELDGLRGIASLTVFFSHVFYMQKIDVVPTAISASIFRSLWDGTAAVFLFFILSGFVLALPSLGASRRPIELFPYIVRRIFRIYPAYIFALFLSMVLMRFVFVQTGLGGLSEWIRSFWANDVSGFEIVRHFTMIGSDTTKIDPPVWTLKVELIISMVFPLIVYVLQGGNSKAICGAIVVTFMAIFATKPSAFFYFALFICGGVLAKYHVPIIMSIRRIGGVAGGLLLVVALCLYSSRFTLRMVGENELVWHILVSSGAALFIILAISYGPFTGLLRTKPVQFLGHISYSFYLLHFPVLLAVSSVTFPKTGSLLLCGAVSLFVSMILSIFAAKFVERPFQTIGKKVSKLPGLSSLQQNFGAKILPRSVP